jgi:hypothetical protein
MSLMGVSPRVVVRDDFGRFISECLAASSRTVDQLLDEGIAISQGLAPVGHKVDRRSPPIHASFYKRKLSRTSGVWGNDARHALAQELGARPHPIVGSPYLLFYWERERRMWVPGLAGTPDIINHPGNEAQPFLRPAYEIVMNNAIETARRNFPGGR